MTSSHLTLRRLTSALAAAAVVGLGVWMGSLSGATATATLPLADAAADTCTVTPPVTPASTEAMLQGLREVNYYPTEDGWGGVWADWRPAMLDADMARIASLGANAVRLFVQPATFGYPKPQPQYLSELSQMVSIAASHGLRVHLTLFDLWHDYWDIAGSREWAAAILQPFYRDPRVAVVELQNEIDPGNQLAMAWARTMLPVIRADSGIPVTVSVGGWDTAAPLAQLVTALHDSQPDFYDQHFYGPPDDAPGVFKWAQQIAAGKPLLIGETGYSTSPVNFSIPGVLPTVAAHEAEQASYFSAVEQDTRAAGLPPAAPWTLYDFAASSNVGPVQQHFGLFRLDGSAKPAAAVVESFFKAAASSTPSAC